MKHLHSLIASIVLLLVSSCCAFSFAARRENKRDSSSVTSNRNNYYYAASTQHYPRNVSTPNLSIRQKKAINLEAFELLIRAATWDSTSTPAQIIVFPESGTGYLMAPDPEIRSWCEPLPSPGWKVVDDSNGINCNNASSSSSPSSQKYQHATWASCMAQKYSIDIVINFGYHDEIDGHFYNSNAAFNKDGIFLVVYRKSHINSVPFLTQPTKPDPVTFVSSFGVTFGLFICYDMWFQNPMRFEIDKMNITDFLYPNGMSSMGPLMTIDAVHAGWSHAHQVNLVSSTMYPAGGAGAFHKGAVIEINDMVPFVSTLSSVKVAKVPMISSPGKWNGDCKSSNSEKSDENNNDKNLFGQSLLHHHRHHVKEQKSKQTPCFGGLANCMEFVPQDNVSATHFLAANYSSPTSFAAIQCTATITTTSGSSHKWFLVAGQADLVPSSNSTPYAFQVGLCILAHCDDANANCDAGAPVPSYWTSDLKISSFAVRASVSRGPSNSGKSMCSISDTNHYPMYSFFDPSSNAIFPLVFPSDVEKSVSTDCGNEAVPIAKNCSGAWFTVQYDGTKDNMNDQKVLYSGGLWLGAKGN